MVATDAGALFITYYVIYICTSKAVHKSGAEHKQSLTQTTMVDLLVVILGSKICIIQVLKLPM